MARSIVQTWVVGATAAVLAACQSPVNRAIADKAEQMTPCEIVGALIQSHRDGFAPLRGAKTTTSRLDIWRARYNLVGRDCQIWQSGQGQTHYVCSQSAPSDEIAQLYYDDAKIQARACLASEWQEKEVPRKLGTGQRTLFSKTGESAAVALHKIKVEGLRDQWGVYFIIGEPSGAL